MASILDDELLSMRLATRPEFHLRLHEFLHAYGAAERAALIVQARPAFDGVFAGISVDDVELQKRFLSGVRTDVSWWEGFQSMRAVRKTFHGIASLPSREKPSWVSEVHRDGHFIAGTWKFPEMQVRGNNVVVIADFFVEMFVHFLQLIESALAPSGDLPSYDVTWTLTQCPQLHYAGSLSFGERSVSPPLQIQHLQWPIATAKVGTEDWKKVALSMGEALTGAYGGAPPSAR